MQGTVPFHVRYTTEFDETGRPLKAYGSATLVVNGESMLDADEMTNRVDDKTETAPSESSEN